MKVIADKNTVFIQDDKTLDYTNSRNFYKTGHGVGLQIDENLKDKEHQIEELCNAISDNFYELQDLIDSNNNN